MTRDEMSTRWWITFKIYILLLECTVGRTTNEQVVNMALLHSTVRHMLGFKQTPASTGASPTDARDPPAYMTHLYEMYKDGRMSRSAGDTVRSIYPTLVNQSHGPILQFDLTALERTTHILDAQLRAFHTGRYADNTTIWVQKTRTSDARKMVIMRTLEGEGWVSVNIITSVGGCTKPTNKRKSCVLSAKMDEKTFTASKPHLLPFIVVFSNEKQLTDTDTTSEKRIKRRLVKTVNAEKTMPSADNSRTRRSVFDNEIPQEPVRLDWAQFKLTKTHPSILISRKKHRYKRRKYGKSKLIPLNRLKRRKHRRGRKNRRRHRKRKNHKDRKLPIPNSWKIMQHNLVMSQDSSLQCKRHKLLVNFADIGWGEWIISPKTFDANYCAGSCPFPLTKNVQPSNHATIQSIIHALGFNPRVPSPCCVPDAMTSITLLYFDEHKNVVLKNYPRMSVVTCGCQ